MKYVLTYEKPDGMKIAEVVNEELRNKYGDTVEELNKVYIARNYKLLDIKAVNNNYKGK